MFRSRRRLLLLADWVVEDKDWSLLQELSKAGYACEVVSVHIPRKYGSRARRVLACWSGYFLLGLKGFLRSGGTDVVIAYQGVAGLFYAWFRRLIGRRPKLILMSFFFKKRENKVYNRARWLFTKIALGGVDLVLTYSRRECQHYNDLFRCRKKKFVFTPFGINVSRLSQMDSLNGQSGDYIFSAGSSNRDYTTLFEAVENLYVPCVVIAKKYNLRGLRIPPNVRVEYDVYGDRYYELMRRSRLVVIPLEDPEVSSGQLVLLEAMGLGKAVIATRCFGTEDYIDDGTDGMLVSPHDAGALRDRILQLLTEPEKADFLGQRARRKVWSRFSVTQLAQGVSQLIEDLLE